MSSQKPYSEFDFDLARAVLDQLVEALDAVARVAGIGYHRTVEVVYVGRHFARDNR
jgi:hypothetical protein